MTDKTRVMFFYRAEGDTYKEETEVGLPVKVIFQGRAEFLEAARGGKIPLLNERGEQAKDPVILDILVECSAVFLEPWTQ